MNPKNDNEYGFVEYIGEKLPYTTKGYDGSAEPQNPEYIDDPEGTILYEFTNARPVWKIHTKMDQEYFIEYPLRYNVTLPGRPKTAAVIREERRAALEARQSKAGEEKKTGLGVESSAKPRDEVKVKLHETPNQSKLHEAPNRVKLGA